MELTSFLLKIGCLGIALAAEVPVGGVEREVVWFQAGDLVNPVARRTDLFLAHQAVSGSENRRGQFDLKPSGELLWTVTATDQAPGWAVFRFGWETEPYPDGIKLEVESSYPDPVGVEFFSGFRLNVGGFYTAQPIPVPLKVELPAGPSEVILRWRDLGAAPEDAAKINALGFVSGSSGELKIRTITMLFDEEAEAERFAARTTGGLAVNQQPMLDVLDWRGVDSTRIREIDDPLRREKLIWDGLDLTAQQVQIDWLNRLGTAADQSIEDLAVLAGRNQAFRDRLAADPAGWNAVGVAELQREVDVALDHLLAEVPAAQRRYPLGEDGKFYAPDGKPWRMFGPFFFRAMYDQDSEMLGWRRWDMRYLAALGFNGLRLFISWEELEPEPGKLNPHLIERIRAIIQEAERYGLGVSIDLHWPYPAWFHAGNPAFGAPKSGRDTQNSYHWSAALVEAWRLLGAELADLPNVVAFEVPTNETPIASDPAGLIAYPELMREWNDWLREQYGSREALDAVWSRSAVNPGQYGLQPDENWEEATIRPMGFQNEKSPEESYRHNPRIQDFLSWVAAKQTKVSGDIVAALRESIPDAVGIFQRTIGDMWDRSPVPLDYRGILTCVGPGVLPGTHYDMGGLQAEKAATLALGAFDSEQQMEDNWPAVEAHVKIGGGFSPFCFHAIGDGGMLLSDHDWHLKREVAYLVEHAEWIKNHQPEAPVGPAVAVIVNSRLEATSGARLGELIAMLRARGVAVKVFDSMRLVQTPELLRDCRGAVTTTSYLDLNLLDILARETDLPVLYYGRLDLDAYARDQAAGLPAALTASKQWLNDSAVTAVAGAAGRLDLTGSWDWKTTGIDLPAGTPMALPTAADANWEARTVPGMWGEIGMTGTRRFHLGDAWYRKRFELPEALCDQDLQLKIGGVDDVDWVWFNGVLIGVTTEATQNYWMVPRNYVVPQELVRRAGLNELVIGVRNLRDDGGIWRGPVELTGDLKQLVRLESGSEPEEVRISSDSTRLRPEQLTPDTAILGWVEVGAERFPALLRQGNRFWWIKDGGWESASQSDNQVLDTFLSVL